MNPTQGSQESNMSMNGQVGSINHKVNANSTVSSKIGMMH